MTFLSGVLTAVLEWAISKIASFLMKKVEQQQEIQKIEDEATKDEKQLESAVTPADKQSAADTLARDSF